MDNRELDVKVARLLGWKIKIEQVPDIANLHRACRTISVYTVTDSTGARWSPCRSLDDVGLLHYSLCYDASLNAAKKLKLFGEQANGLDVVLYQVDDEWQICGIDWRFQEMDVIASGDKLPLVICQAIIALRENNE